MKITVLAARDLGFAEIARWSEIQASTPPLDTPCLAPDFVRCAAAARERVEVAILEEGRGVLGFFPFERGRGGVAHPVARTFSDFQAVIAEPNTELDPLALLRGCGLVACRFDHLVAAHSPFRPFHWSEAPSPYVDLSAGFEGWRAERKSAGSKEIEKILYERRKAERRLGPIRFELHASDEKAFAALVRWKSAQLRATGQPNLFAQPWVLAFLERIRAARGEAFAGVLSALYIGDSLAAVHLGVRSRTVLHYWLPAYDPELAPYSPGQLCLLESARAVAPLGVNRIDLGKGPETYKERLMSGAIPIAEGAVHLRPGVGAAWRARYRAVEWARRSPIRHVLRVPWRWWKRAMASAQG
jgi:CelD/BcsL family acetyltransferase involved in cellulose biosynthesis